MKRLTLSLVALLLLPIASIAQTANVPVTAILSWNNPTTDTAGGPLTGAAALTKVQIFASGAAIADASTILPVQELTATAPGVVPNTFTHSTTAANGSTLYFRIKACNIGGCSNFSAQATKVVRVTTPTAPDGLNVAVTVVVSISP